MHFPLADQLDYKTDTEVMNIIMEIVYEKCGVKISPKEGDHRRYRRNFCSREKKV